MAYAALALAAPRAMRLFPAQQPRPEVIVAVCEGITDGELVIVIQNRSCFHTP
jgi:hypothetical protein